MLSIEKRISKIGLGLSQFNNNLYKKKKFSKKNVLKFLRYSLSKGIKYFDTANNYGNTESIIGELDKSEKKKIIVSTKAGFIDKNLRNFDPKYLENEILKSLKRMKIEKINIFFLNKPSIRDIEKNDLLIFCENMKKKGLIEKAGIIVGEKKLPEYVYKSKQIKCFSFLYNLLNVENYNDIIFSKRNKKVIFARSPLNSGLLTNNFNLNLYFNKNDYRFFDFKGKNFELKKKKISLIIKELKIDQHDLTKFASKFVLSHKNIDSCIFGATSIDHINNLIKFKRMEDPISLKRLNNIRNKINFFNKKYKTYDQYK